MSDIAPSGLRDAPSEVSRWGTSFAIVLGLHAAVLAGIAAYTAAPTQPGEPLPALMIDMAPPSATPSSAPAQEETQEAAIPDPVPDAPPAVPEPDVTPPEPLVTAEVSATRELPAPLLPLQEIVPPIAIVREAAAVPTSPPPRKAAPPPPAKKVEKPEAKKPPKPIQAKQAELQRGAARPAQQGPGAQTTASTGASSSVSTGSSAASRAGWQGAIVAALNRAKRPQQDSGTASVRFSVDRGGRVLSASLAGSTGVASLDQEAVSLVRRANIPAPPANVPGEAFTFTVPIRFTPQ